MQTKGGIPSVVEAIWIATESLKSSGPQVSASRVASRHSIWTARYVSLNIARAVRAGMCPPPCGIWTSWAVRGTASGVASAHAGLTGSSGTAPVVCFTGRDTACPEVRGT